MSYITGYYTANYKAPKYPSPPLYMNAAISIAASTTILLQTQEKIKDHIPSATKIN